MNITEEDINIFFQHKIQFEAVQIVLEISKDKRIKLADEELSKISKLQDIFISNIAKSTHFNEIEVFKLCPNTKISLENMIALLNSNIFKRDFDIQQLSQNLEVDNSYFEALQLPNISNEEEEKEMDTFLSNYLQKLNALINESQKEFLQGKLKEKPILLDNLSYVDFSNNKYLWSEEDLKNEIENINKIRNGETQKVKEKETQQEAEEDEDELLKKAENNNNDENYDQNQQEDIQEEQQKVQETKQVDNKQTELTEKELTDNNNQEEEDKFDFVGEAEDNNNQNNIDGENFDANNDQQEEQQQQQQQDDQNIFEDEDQNINANQEKDTQIVAKEPDINEKLESINQNQIKYLNQKIVKRLEKDPDTKKQIEKLKTYQSHYLQTQKEIGNESQNYDDIRIIFQNIANVGLYETINVIVKLKWQKSFFSLILLGILVFPFTLFHIFMVLSNRFTIWLAQYQFSFKFFDNDKVQFIAEINKNVPEGISNEDFYFDEDVAQLDAILCRRVDLENQEQSNLKENARLICKYLKDPQKYNFNNIFQQLQQTNKKQKFNLLNYVDLVFFLNMVIFQIGICIVYNVVRLNLKHQCLNSDDFYDVPFYVISVIQLIIEAGFMFYLQEIICTQKIFTLKSVGIWFHLYTSFMSRYDMYTDMIFSLNTFICEELGAVELGLISLIVMLVNMTLSLISQCWEFYDIYQKRQSVIKQNGKHSLHNTTFINEYTKLSLIQEFSALGHVLDRFSTSSASDLSGFWVPNSLEHTKVPQVLISKFQKVFLEDMPQLAILLAFNFRKSASFNDWNNLKVILSTLLNLYNALSAAWVARPSIFRTYMMREYLEFRQQNQDLYRLEIGFKKSNTYLLGIDKTISRILNFNSKYTMVQTKQTTNKKQENQKDKETIKDGVSQSQAQSQAKKQSQSQVQSVHSQQKSEHNISEKGQNDNQSQVSGKSGNINNSNNRQSQNQIGSNNKISKNIFNLIFLIFIFQGKTKNKTKSIDSKQFQIKLFEYLMQKEKQYNFDDNNKQD
ncbi:hypothetical protein IMG5_100190 [Ichthyophthirius multifiliis]|uniref:Transmembrane protein n=1 Tax=Ichthyophthirius multifiliis TaxID=5932 RepID=G0QSC3_ICHMU|nr:hypothetical protein IMG5_100190 [Ichthyophthirius multifiliis]EGR31870.1 hypothetical protein IMG5_100190 [Ichthyophthirius multifiliis]|eukprot:XP_004035356.1 hypothetical protein IMG5_100190 [Ichthyophthirius multifiliis]